MHAARGCNDAAKRGFPPRLAFQSPFRDSSVPQLVTAARRHAACATDLPFAGYDPETGYTARTPVRLTSWQLSRRSHRTVTVVAAVLDAPASSTTVSTRGNCPATA